METTITSFEAACVANNVLPTLPDVSLFPEPLQKFILATLMLDGITKAMNNEGLETPWVPDYDNWDEDKFWPVFVRSAGGVWSYNDCDLWGTSAYAGARPFRRRQDAKFAATNFPDLYNDILNYQNS